MLEQNSYKKHLTVEEELERHTKRVQNLEAYLDSIDLNALEDRMDYKETKAGGIIKTVIANKEAQVKSYADTAEKLTKLFSQLDELRNKYAEKQMLTRGNVETKNTGLDFASKI